MMRDEWGVAWEPLVNDWFIRMSVAHFLTCACKINYTLQLQTCVRVIIEPVCCTNYNEATECTYETKEAFLYVRFGVHIVCTSWCACYAVLWRHVVSTGESFG